jgi:hypothetical protein
MTNKYEGFRQTTIFIQFQIGLMKIRVKTNCTMLFFLLSSSSFPHPCTPIVLYLKSSFSSHVLLIFVIHRYFLFFPSCFLTPFPYHSRPLPHSFINFHLLFFFLILIHLLFHLVLLFHLLYQFGKLCLCMLAVVIH